MQIVIPFAQVTAINPNLMEMEYAANISKYFKCIAVACHSFRQQNPEIEIKIVTNIEVESFFAKLFESLNVEILIIDYTFNPPHEFGDTFRGCFFLFDALKILTRDSLIIDPDVICLQSVGEMQSLLRHKIAVFRPLFNSDKVINGLSPNQANEIYNIYLGKSFNSEPRHVGGEAIFVPIKSINELLHRVSQFWDWNIDRAKRGEAYLTTEEHILTVLLRSVDCDSLSPYLSRIWTAKSYREIEGDSQDIQKMVMWHLPSEKNRGFQSVFAQIFDSESVENKNQLRSRDFYGREMNLKQNVLEKLRYRLYRNLKS